MKRRLLLAGGAAALAGCAAPDVTDYRAERPALDLRTYFDGRVEGHGLFIDRNDKVVKRFTVRMDCRWQGDEGVFAEYFLYSDGSTQQRTWRVRKLPQGRYTGSAGDVVGEASGQASGNAFRWNYTLALPVDGRTWEVQMDDWMFLVDAGVLLNRTVMRKFGIRLGEVMLSFRKLP